MYQALLSNALFENSVLYETYHTWGWYILLQAKVTFVSFHTHTWILRQGRVVQVCLVVTTLMLIILRWDMWYAPSARGQSALTGPVWNMNVCLHVSHQPFSSFGLIWWWKTNRQIFPCLFSSAQLRQYHVTWCHFILVLRGGFFKVRANISQNVLIPQTATFSLLSMSGFDTSENRGREIFTDIKYIVCHLHPHLFLSNVNSLSIF